MEERVRTRFSPSGLILSPAEPGGEEQELALMAGELHYWRVAPASWRRCLEAMAALGFHIVQTHVPWSVHEPRRGALEWDRELDLARFLDLVAELGMLAIVRPGPAVNAELTGFGFPDWLLANDAVLARDRAGNPAWLPAPPRAFALPSYASNEFQEHVARWLGAVGDVVAPRRWPEGPVVAVHVDNAQPHLLRGGAFDTDYHPAALGWWHEHLAEQGLEAWDPPRAWNENDAERCLRWIEFKQVYAARALQWIGAAMTASAMTGIARVHNAPPLSPFDVSIPMLARGAEGLCGLELSPRTLEERGYYRRARYLVGCAALPVATELGVGGAPWLPPVEPSAQHNAVLGLLSCGLRGFAFYMTVDRDRWYGAAIGPNAEALEPQHAFLRQLLATLRDVNWHHLRPASTPVALVLSRADARAALASSAANPVPPIVTEFLQLGPGGAAELALDADGAEHRRWFSAVETALDAAQIRYTIVDESALENLGDYPIVIMPTLRRASPETWAALGAAADAGSRVIVGPQLPEADEWGRESSFAALAGMGLIRPESLVDFDGLAADFLAVLDSVATEDSTDEFWLVVESDTPKGPRRAADASVFQDSTGVARVLFVRNHTNQAARAEVVVPAGTRCADGLSNDSWRERDGVIAIDLAPRQVRLLRLHLG